MLRLFLTAGVLALVAPRSGWAGEVTVVQTPDGGIQPQTVVDDVGNVHLIYYKGDAGAGDLFYVRKNKGQPQFSAPMRVNSQPASAIAAGTVRGGQIAIGKNRRVHVAWNGSGHGSKGNDRGVPMLYARMNDHGTGFEPQRNLMQHTALLDGGGTIAADGLGNVYVAWHGVNADGPRGEGNRQLWVAHSSDEGKSFAAEEPAWKKPTGACACCSTRAFADSKGAVYMLYRSAEAEVNRDMYLVASLDQGSSFAGAVLHKWRVPG